MGTRIGNIETETPTFGAENDFNFHLKSQAFEKKLRIFNQAFGFAFWMECNKFGEFFEPERPLLLNMRKEIIEGQHMSAEDMLPKGYTIVSNMGRLNHADMVLKTGEMTGGVLQIVEQADQQIQYKRVSRPLASLMLPFCF